MNLSPLLYMCPIYAPVLLTKHRDTRWGLQKFLSFFPLNFDLKKHYSLSTSDPSQFDKNKNASDRYFSDRSMRLGTFLRCSIAEIFCIISV